MKSKRKIQMQSNEFLSIIKKSGMIWLSVLLCLKAVNGILFALALKYGIDAATSNDRDGFLRWCLCLMLIILAQMGLHLLHAFYEEWKYGQTEIRLRNALFDHLLSASIESTQQYDIETLMMRIHSDVAIVSQYVVSTLPSLLSMALKLLAILALAYWLHPSLFLLFLAGILIVLFFSFLPRQRFQSNHRSVQIADETARSFIKECLEHMEVILSYTKQAQVSQIAHRLLAQYQKQRQKRSNAMNVLQWGMQMMMQIAFLISVIWCGFHLLEADISYGSFLAVIQLVQQLQSPFAGMSSILPQASMFTASLQRINEIFAMRTYPHSLPYEESSLYDHMKCICLEHICFGYDQAALLYQDYSTTIEKGECIAIVGDSGAGKSTLMKLLLSFYQPHQGEVYYCAEDGAKLPLAQLNNALFAYVPQTSAIFSGTILEIVSLWDAQVNETKVIDACKAACIHEVIMKLPHGYHSKLQAGEQLSQGELQRLAIARALYSERKILLLDEATSALDEACEQAVLLSLKKQARTILLATHHPNAMKVCDRIIQREEWQ